MTKDPPPINKRFSEQFRDFVKLCLTKDPEKRPSAEFLLDHPFMKNANDYKEEFRKFVIFWKEKDNIGISMLNL